MKKILYLIGFLGSVVFAVGATFKLLDISGGNELFIAGFLTLLLVFFPLLAIVRYKAASSRVLYERLIFIFGGTAAAISGLSGLFKILHLAGANVLLALGTFVFVVGFLPFLFYTMYKKSAS